MKYATIIIGSHKDGGRLALFSEGRVSPSVYIDTGYPKDYSSIVERRAMPMDILSLMAVLSFGLTCFSVGYTFGKDYHTKK